MSSSKKYRLVQRSMTMQERLPQGKYRKLSEEEITLDWLRFSRQSFLGDGRNTSPKLTSNVVSLDPIDTVLMKNQPDWSQLGTTRSMPENVESTSSLKRRQPKFLKVFSHRLSRKSPSKEDVRLSVTEEVCDSIVPEKKVDNERAVSTDESHDEQIQPNVSIHEDRQQTRFSKEKRKDSKSSSSSSSSSLSSKGNGSVTRINRDSVPIDEYLLKYGLVPKSVNSNSVLSDRSSDTINGITDGKRNKISLKDGEERKNMYIRKSQINTSRSAESDIQVESSKRIKNSSITSTSSASSASTSESNIKLTPTKIGIVPIDQYLNPHNCVSRSAHNISTEGARGKGSDGRKGSDSNKGNVPAMEQKNLESVALISKSDLDLVQKRKQKDKRKSYDPIRHSCISVGIQAPDDNAITFWDARYDAPDFGTDTKTFKMHALVTSGTDEIKFKADDMDTDTVNMRMKSEIPFMVREIPEPSLSIVHIGKATLTPREVEAMHSESTEGPILQRRHKFENAAQNIGPSTYDMPDDKGNYISVDSNRHNIQGYDYTTVPFHEKPPFLDDATLDSLQESCVDDAACLSPANTIQSNNEQMPSGGTAVQIAQAGGYYRAITNDNITRPGRSSTSSNSSSSSSSSKNSEGSSLIMDRANSSEKAYEEEHNQGHANTEKEGNGKMDAVNNGHYRKKAWEHPRFEHRKSERETITSDIGRQSGGVKKIVISGVFPGSDGDGLEQEKLTSSPTTTFDDDHCMGEKRKIQFDSAASFEEDHRECKEGQQKSQYATSIEKDHLNEANENTSDTGTSALEKSHSESEESSTGDANEGKVKIKTMNENDNHGTGAVNETDDRNTSIETEIACGDMADIVTQSTFIRPESPASSDISREIARVSDPCESDHSTSSASSFSSSSPSHSSGSKNGNRSSHKLEKNSPKMSQDRQRQITYNGPVFLSENNQDKKLQNDSTSNSFPTTKDGNVNEKLPDKLRSEFHDEKKLLKRVNCGKDVSLSNSSVSSTDKSSEKARRRRQSSSSSSSQNSHHTEELSPRSIQSDLQGDPSVKTTHAEFSGGKGSDEFGTVEIGERIEQLKLNQGDAMPSASTYNYSDIHSALNTLDNVIHTSGVHVRTHSENAGTLRTAGGHFVVVAIDFGTTYSGYAFSFTRDPESIYMMRKWEGGDPGVINQKTLTTLLLTPDEKFHSFGYAARDFFHDLDPDEAINWLYFEKFKMMLHYNANLCSTTLLTASNGRQVPALSVFSHALRFFKERVLEELSDQSGMKIINEDIRWVLTVPAIWKAQAKQFMRQASYDAGLVSPEFPDQLLVALEPEVASIYCRKLRMHQLIPEGPPIKSPLRSPRKSQPDIPPNKEMACKDFVTDSNLQRSPSCSSSNLQRSPCCSSLDTALSPSDTVDSLVQGMRYMVVDCGGGTVDITVHEIDTGGRLNELHRATGGPYGSVGVDLEFEKLLHGIFGVEFIEQFKLKCPAGWVDLMINFESRKRSASPYSASSLNVSLPFSFINYYKKSKGSHIESIIKKYGDKEIRWSSQGMLRLSPEAMRRLFLPTLDRIKQTIGDVLNDPETKGVKYLFLVGGFAESAFLQTQVRQEFRHILQVIIPQEVSLTIVKGAVLFALDPTVVNLRRSRMTYGVGVLNRFDPSKHPIEKKVTKDGIDWCTDVFDKFVMIDQPIAQGDVVVRSYTPARPGQKTSQINVYCTDEEDVMFITDIGVKKCGTLALDLEPLSLESREPPIRREIQTRMMFGETEIKVSAIDMSTGTNVYCSIDFLNR